MAAIGIIVMTATIAVLLVALGVAVITVVLDALQCYK